MGIRNEDAVKADHYFCEKCRPDLHVELLKYVASTPTSTDNHIHLSRRLAKRPRDRHPSTNSHPNTTSANRKSRSHSPTHQKPQKRRNTMNSRDAAYDELEMMALLVDSAAEAAAAVAVQSSPSPINGSVNGLADVDEQAPSPATAKKKRKRGSEDAFVTSILVCLASLNLLLSVAHQSNGPDPRRRPRTVRLYPNPHMRTHQQRHPSLSQCPRLQYLLRRVAGRGIDVGEVGVADPLPRRKTRRRLTGMRVSNLI